MLEENVYLSWNKYAAEVKLVELALFESEVFHTVYNVSVEISRGATIECQARLTTYRQTWGGAWSLSWANSKVAHLTLDPVHFLSCDLTLLYKFSKMKHTTLLIYAIYIESNTNIRRQLWWNSWLWHKHSRGSSIFNVSLSWVAN